MNRNGAEMRTLDLMRASDRQDFAFDFCSLSGMFGDLDGEISSLGGNTHLCKLNPTFPVKFIRLLRRERFDVVHSHVHFSSGFILLLARAAGVKCRIAHFRNTSDGPTTGRLRQYRRMILKWLIDKNATKVLAVSKGVMAAAWRDDWAGDARCEVTYNTVDLMPYQADINRSGVRQEFGFPLNSRIIIHIGRMDDQKNHQRLIRIFSKLVALDEDVYLLSVGRSSEPQSSFIRTLVDNLGLNQRVKFAGPRADVPRLLMASDALLFPSLWEGLPGVVLESCAAAIPVVATDLPGVLEIAEHFVSVRPMPLSSPDDAWASTVLASINESRSSPAEARTVFQESPFWVSTVLKKHTEAWIGAI